MSRTGCAALLLWLCLVPPAWAGDAVTERGEASALLLGLDSAWRGHLTLRTPLVGPRDAARPRTELDMWADAEFPPQDWTAEAFDDSSWLRTSGGLFVGATARGGGGDLGRFGFGPDGAVSTVRREVFVEGVQLAEAVIFLDKCLSDNAVRATADAELVQRCRALLADRGRRAAWSCAGYHPKLRPIDSKYHSTMEVPQDGVCWHISSDWQDRALDLFRAAAEMQATVGR